MKKLFFLIVLLFLTNALFAQPQDDFKRGIIKGYVEDASSNQALEFATVSIFDDSESLVGGGITNEEGYFEMNVSPGTYMLRIEFISYETNEIQGIVLDRNNTVVDLGKIKIAVNAEALEEVVITERKSQVQLTLDKKVFNVGQDLTNRGGTAEDVLDNVPSISVDLDGNVSLRGNGGVRILIDGKPSLLVGQGNTNGLRNLPANSIERVEVVTNPSSKYEAEGMAGIINIILKKEKKNGFNGSFDFTGGLPALGGTAFNLNYRREKLNLFSSVGLRYQSNPGFGTNFQETNFLSGESQLFSTDRQMNRSGISGNVRLGMDYYMNNYNILTSSFSISRSNEDNDNSVLYEDYIGSKDNLSSVTKRTDDELENEFNTEYALTYERKFAGKNHNLVADLRFQDNIESESSDFLESYFDAFEMPTGQEDLIQRSANDEGERRLLGRLDYTKPLSNKGKLEAGYFGSFRSIDNDYLVEEIIDNQWTRLSNLSNDFNYDEYINAAYALFGQERDRWSYQLGVRMEHSRVITELLDSDKPANDRNYTNFFPSGALSYKINETNSAQLSYSRRIRRPRLWDLNPFFTFSDPRSQFSGNPDLDPEFSDAYEASYIKYFDRGSLTSSIYYRLTTNVIQRVRTVDDQGISYSSPENLSSRNSYGFEFTGNYDLFKWWNINGNLNLFRAITDGGNLGEEFQADTYSWFTRLNNRFNFSKSLGAQLRVNYRAPQETTQGSRQGVASVDLGIAKEFTAQNISISLNVRDLFNSRKRRYISDFDLFDDEGSLIGDFYSEGEFQWRSRQVTLALNYRLNQDNNKRRRDRSERQGGYEGDGGEMF